jgi:DNA-binding GntR family transcriptional regulator
MTRKKPMSVTPIAISAEDGTADRVATAITRLIVDGEFGPGDRLKLSDLAARFGVGLMPVREALWKLEGSGLVENIPNRGALVRAVDAQHVANVYELRAAIDAALIERAVTAMTAGDLDRIEAARLAVERAAKQGAIRAMMLADAVFHEAINTLAGNDLAMAMLRGTMPLMQSMRLRVGIIPDRVGEMLREHADIVAALREGDAHERRASRHAARPAGPGRKDGAPPWARVTVAAMADGSTDDRQYRRSSVAVKAAILSELRGPGATLRIVARRHAISVCCIAGE